MLFFQASYKKEIGYLLADKEHVTDGIGSEQFLTYILIACAVFFMFSIAMTIYMVIRRNYKNKKKVSDEKLKEKYQNFLSSFLILPIDNAFLGIRKDNNQEHRLDLKDISDSYRRQVLANEIYTLKKDLCGQQESQLVNYFFGLGLQEDIIKMIRSSDWAKKVKAMQIVKAFNIVECLPDVQKYINSENRELAIHAIELRIVIDNSIGVLNEINVKLNDWECHKIANVINQMELSFGEMQSLKQNIYKEDSCLKRLELGLIDKDSSILDLKQTQLINQL